MPSASSDHFDHYPIQTQIKHRILSAYLPAYVTALKNQVRWYHYIDGFAGCGSYEGIHPGSPLLAMQQLEGAGVVDRSTLSLVEEVPDYFAELELCLAEDPRTDRLAETPMIRRGRFDVFLSEILNRSFCSRSGGVATFSFIDPCGVEGVHMGDLVRLLEQQYGELLLFFNYDGINRILGGLEKQTIAPEIAEAFFGSAELVASLIPALRSLDSPRREALILSTFVEEVKSRSGVRYFMPFRFETKGRHRTSHYIFHYCRNPLPFKIIKNVMWSAGQAEGESYGRPELRGDRHSDPQLDLFRDDIGAQKDRIVAALTNGDARVKKFSSDWMFRPDDRFSQKVYKQMIMELGREGRLIVYDKANKVPWPAEKRMNRKHGETLGDDYWLRLKR